MKNNQRNIKKNFSFENEDGLSSFDIALIFSKKNRNCRPRLEDNYKDSIAA